VDRALEIAGAEVSALGSQLRALSPQQTLDRGYAIAHTSEGKLVRTVDDAPAKKTLTITLAKGTISAVSEGPTKVES
jgi:exodeoxyribonuclease VII large subunit